MRYPGKWNLFFVGALVLSLLAGCGTVPVTTTAQPALASPTFTPAIPAPTSSPVATAPVSPTPTPSPEPTATLASLPLHNGLLKEIFPGLSQLAKMTKEVRLESGLSDMFLSSDLNYRLKLDETGLHGLALYEAYFYVAKINTFEDARQISVPPGVVTQFLDKLTQTPMEEGPYNGPGNRMTDYYPFLSFALETTQGTLWFGSDSQKDDFSPWQVTFAGRNFYAANGLPFEAYNLIRPYLQTEVIEELSGQFSQGLTQKWNIDTNKPYPTPPPLSPLNQLKATTFKAKDLGYSYTFNTPTGMLAVTTGQNLNGVRLFNSDLTPAKDLESTGGRGLTLLAFSPDGKYLAGTVDQSRRGYNNPDPTIYIWEVGSGKVLTRLAGVPGTLALAFSQDDKILVSAGSDRTVRLWSLPDGKNTVTLQAAFPEIYTFLAVAISPDGTRVAAGGNGNVSARQFPVKVWDLKNNRAETTLQGHAAPLAALAFSPDGKTLLSGDAEGTLRLWSSGTAVQPWTQAGTALGSGPAVVTAVFSPDGTRVLTAHSDSGVRVWDANGLKLLSVTVPAPVEAGYFWSAFPAFFSADGRNILTYSTKDYASIEYRLWSVN